MRVAVGVPVDDLVDICVGDDVTVCVADDVADIVKDEVADPADDRDDTERAMTLTRLLEVSACEQYDEEGKVLCKS